MVDVKGRRVRGAGGTGGGDPVLLDRVWRRMFDFFLATAPARQRCLQARGLTANDARALFGLSAKQGRPIGGLASEWGCDPSNATFIIDKLEKAGLAERQLSPLDRRLKLVVLTPSGESMRRDLLAEYHLAPEPMRQLSTDELAVLETIFLKLAPPEQPDSAGRPPEESNPHAP